MNAPDNFLDQEKDAIDIFKEINYYVFFWPWFLISMLLCSFGSYVYLRYAETVYQTNATLQVKDASSDPSSFLTEGAGAMFNFNRVKIDNYIAQINSNPNLTKVIERLDLQTKVYGVGRVKETLFFADEIPFQIVYKSNKINSQISLFLEPTQGIIEIGEDTMIFDPSQ